MNSTTTKTLVIRRVHGEHDLFTPAEVMAATGMKPGTFKYRRRALHIPPTKFYTLAQVEAIVHYHSSESYAYKHQENIDFLTNHFKEAMA